MGSRSLSPAAAAQSQRSERYPGGSRQPERDWKAIISFGQWYVWLQGSDICMFCSASELGEQQHRVCMLRLFQRGGDMRFAFFRISRIFFAFFWQVP